MATKILISFIAIAFVIRMSKAATPCKDNSDCSVDCLHVYGVGRCVSDTCSCVECNINTDCHIRCLGAHCSNNTCLCGDFGVDRYT